MTGFRLQASGFRKVALGCCLALLGCAAEKKPAQTPFATVATVNGVVLTQADLDAALGGGGHNNGDASLARRQKVLEGLVRDELVRQRAVELGLVPNPQHQEELARLEAKLVQAQRRALSDAFYKHEVEAQVAVSEAQARRLFEENQAQLKTELKLNQLLFRDEKLADQAVAALEHGEAFEQLARRQFPELPDSAGRPWELGFLSWRQMPPAWRPVIFNLAAGQTTGVVKGPNNRFWVLQVIDRRTNPALTFEQVKADLMAELKAALTEARAAELDAELRKRAHITLESLAHNVAAAAEGVAE